MRLDYITAGESHGPQLTAILRGIPAGMKLDPADLQGDMARRQGGYGRGVRMNIEKDKALVRSGVRKGYTLGSPITLVVENRDYSNWETLMSPEPGELLQQKLVTRPRPGHADLAGAIKFNHRDARNILERSSARETAARVAVGAVCRCFLLEFGISIYSHVVNIGGITVDASGMSHKERQEAAEKSPFRIAHPDAEPAMRKLIDDAKANGDTIGGVYELVACGVPMGLGNTMNWDEKLDARLAYGLMSCQAIKAVGIGLGFSVADTPGSQVQDPIAYTASPDEIARIAAERGRGPSGGFYHESNNAGGIEGGMSNGEPVVVRVAMKPIATLMKPLKSVDMDTKEPFDAVRERSDVSAVPAAGVVGEAIMCFVLAQAFMEKFGGDSMTEVRRNYDSYVQYMREF